MAQESFLHPPMPDVLDQWRFYLKQLQVKPGNRVLDVGCHAGDAAALLLQLYPYVGHVTGLEKNDELMAKAQARRASLSAPQLLEFIAGDAHNLPFADASFDRIICVDTLEWLGEPKVALKEMRRVLKAGGRAVVIHTDFDSQIFASRELDRMRRIVHAFTDAGPDGTLGRRLASLCRTAGFAQVDTKVYTLFNEAFGENLYGYRAAHMMVDWLVQKKRLLDARVGESWLAELEALAAQGEFFYSVNRNICICQH